VRREVFGRKHLRRWSRIKLMMAKVNKYRYTFRQCVKQPIHLLQEQIGRESQV
jgi:hypothetical protein